MHRHSYLILLVVLAAASLLAQEHKANRILSIDVNEGQGVDYPTAFSLAQDIGIGEVKQSLDWNYLDTANGYDFSIIDLINYFYPLMGSPVSLIFRPINTNQPTLPPDLSGKPLDDDEVIQRFKILLDSVKAHLDSTEVRAIHVGNEISAYLGTDDAKWNRFTTFYDSARLHIKRIWGNSMRVGSVGMWGAMTTPGTAGRYQSINHNSDIIAVTYYPLNIDFTVREPVVVANDFQSLLSLYPDKPIHFVEAGYPSSALCNSSQEKQKQFIIEMFNAWDTHKDRVELIDFTWMHDQDSAIVEQWVVAYGMSGLPNADKFAAYLGSLGMRTRGGSDKTAFTQLKLEAAARGWGTTEATFKSGGLSSTRRFRPVKHLLMESGNGPPRGTRASRNEMYSVDGRSIPAPAMQALPTQQLFVLPASLR
ncbi:MAG: hypothetical protein GF398_08995 [Chitinivibrionales bacterium]|nr:hypothetical protein [Chitinivibrionales bacterium]